MPDSDKGVPVPDNESVPESADEASAPPAPVRRDEAEETGLAPDGEVEELVRPKPKPPHDKSKVDPPEPPKPPVPPTVDIRGPSSGWWWLTFGLVCVATLTLVVHVYRNRGKRASPGPA